MSEVNDHYESESYCKRMLRNVYLVFADLLRRHSLTFVIGGLLATYLGKISWHTLSLEIEAGTRMGFLAFLAEDLLFYAGVIVVLWSVETFIRKNWIRWVTAVLSFCIAFLSIANVLWLRGTGEQITIPVIRVGLERLLEVMPVIEAGLGQVGIQLLVLSLLLPLGLPFLFKAKWKRDRLSERLRWSTLAFPLLLVILGVIGWVGRCHPDIPRWRMNADNVHLSLIRSLVTADKPDGPPGGLIDPVPVPAQLQIEPDHQPNIVLVILEAAGHRATSLAYGGPRTTPNLRRLAAEGLRASSMRAVLPHTTKSVFSILCGQYPAMQHEILETADNYPMRCVGSIMSECGYATAFFQSAEGSWEDRPRLVANMGFKEFYAQQDMSQHVGRLGYLGGDDRGLEQPVLAWAHAQERPYFLVVLTSATHHPYQLPKRLVDKLREKSDRLTEFQRYLFLLNKADELVGALHTGLVGEDDDRQTVFIITGDHGEAFGEHGGRQHDNIFWEEGLKVPFVIWAPGRVSAGGVVSGERSLVDVAPTVLDLAGIKYIAERFAGRSLLRQQDGSVRRFFSCWYNNTCAGYVENNIKYVVTPSIRTWFVCELMRDPNEIRPLIEPGEAERQMEQIYSWYQNHRYLQEGLLWRSRSLFDDRWRCGQGPGNCTHVLAVKGHR